MEEEKEEKEEVEEDEGEEVDEEEEEEVEVRLHLSEKLAMDLSALRRIAMFL